MIFLTVQSCHIVKCEIESRCKRMSILTFPLPALMSLFFMVAWLCNVGIQCAGVVSKIRVGGNIFFPVDSTIIVCFTIIAVYTFKITIFILV
jgi:hypothetical protein